MNKLTNWLLNGCPKSFKKTKLKPLHNLFIAVPVYLLI